MQPIDRRFILTAVIVALTLMGCNLSAANATPGSTEDAFAGTLSALQTRAVMTATAQGVSAPITPSPAPTGGSGLGVPSQKPVAVRDTLCWVGPGPAFEVVSAILKGTSVELLGKATIPGWFIIRNPIYLDPCWIQASDLQMDPSLDLSGLPLFNPPLTATPTPGPTSAATAAPTGATSTTAATTAAKIAPTTAPSTSTP